jgi:uncharacterized PurR-regulated membrane protein YhhQ (DUF165 family)
MSIRDARVLHPFDGTPLQARRERVFLVLAGLFLGAMAMLNILGITKFIRLGPFELAVGVLPYPLTFLCTDLVSELYGRARANALVLTGFAVNVFVLVFISVGDALPSIDFRTPVQRIVTLDTVGAVNEDGSAVVDPATGFPLAQPARRLPKSEADQGPSGPGLVPLAAVRLEPLAGAPAARRLVDAQTGAPLLREESLFGRIATATRQAVFASMVAYLFAQLVDVWLFHFWKRLTQGRHLWLRNNGSTLVSQLVDTVCVVGITFWGSIVAGDVGTSQVLRWIAGGYAFKFTVALLDTLPFYFFVGWLTRFLQVDPVESDPELR